MLEIMNTFVQVALDSTTTKAVIPEARGEQKTIQMSQSAEPASSHGMAACAAHLRWSLASINAMMRGERPNMDWKQSWTVNTVTDLEWQQLLEDLKLEYQNLQNNMPPNPDLSDRMFVTSGVALVAHAAYHLGAIRQMLKG